MYEKIIELLKETIINEYFLYSIVIITILTISKGIKDYKLYILDCAILNQKPKPIGFVINTIVNIVGLIIISNIAFTGYTIYKHQEIFNTETYYTLEEIEKEDTKNINHTYTIEKVTTHNKPITKHPTHQIIKKPIAKVKPIRKEMTAKEKLKREMEQAIEDVN